MKQSNRKNGHQEQDEVKLTWQQKIMLDLHDLIYVLAGFMLVYMLLFRVVVVVGPSMKDTLVDGDRLVLLSNTFYRNPKCGDIIVASKDSFNDGECIIKRVIATEGQEVNITFDGDKGVVSVDGVVLQEDYARVPTRPSNGLDYPVTVPDGCVFVLGDNRPCSMDSRSTQIGFLDKREILGKAIFLLMPGTDGGTIEADYDRIGMEVLD